MKVLFVSPVPTDLGGAGNRARIATLVEAVRANGHEVHFAYIPFEDADLAVMQDRFGPGKLHVLPWTMRQEGRASTWLRKIGRVLKLDAAFLWELDAWYDFEANKALKQLDNLHHFDAVFVEYVFMSKAFDAFPARTPKILDTHDCFGMRHRSYLKAGEKPRWFSTSLQDEICGFQRANVVIGIQPDETDSFRQRLGPCRTKVVQLSHFIDGAPAFARTTRPSAILVGSDNPINVSAAEFFITHILPTVQKAVPEFVFYLAGKVSNSFQETAHIKPLGFVSNLANAYGQALVAVNPVQMGTGINIKLLDAMAHGMPCISTTSGARGLEHLAENTLIVVDDRDSDAFANRLIELLRTPQRLHQLQEASEKAALDWNRQQQQTLEALLAG